MVLIEAIPLKRGFDYDYQDKHYIAAHQIVSASYSTIPEVNDNKINVRLIDGTEWMINRDEFDVMIIKRKGK